MMGLQELINRLIDLQIEADDAEEEMGKLKKRIRARAEQKRKNGETMISWSGDRGMVRVIFAEELKLSASGDEVLKAMGEKAYDVFEVDSRVKVKIPKNFTERLERENEETRQAALDLIERRAKTPRVEIEVPRKEKTPRAKIEAPRK